MKKSRICLSAILGLTLAVAVSCGHTNTPKTIGNDDNDCALAVDSVSVEESEVNLTVEEFFSKATSGKIGEAAKLYDGTEKEFRTFYKNKFNKKSKIEWKWMMENIELKDDAAARVKVSITFVDDDSETEDEVKTADIYLRNKKDEWKVYDMVFF